MLELAGIRWSAGGRTILGGVDLACARGTLTVLLGPNGAGKSTLLRIAAGLLRPDAGEVRLAGRPLGAYSSLALARARAVLSQHAEPAFPLTAGEVVEMGRYPHYQRVAGRRDHEAVARALAVVGMTAQRGQPFTTLSAGERQKIHMARVLAQIDDADGGERVLFLDEPTSNLDVHHQLHLLTIARERLARGVTVLAVLHDINHACEFADQLVLLEHGRVVHAGSREQGLPAPLLEQVYAVRARLVRDPADGRAFWRFGA